MIDISELKKVFNEDSLGMGQVILPILEFFDFLCESNGFKNDAEAQKYFTEFIIKHEEEMRLEFEKNEEIDAVTFAEIASIPLKKLCDKLVYPKKEELLQRYKYIIAAMQVSQYVD